jgi:hypothetical protein
MSRTVRGTVYGAAAVLALDTLGSIASRLAGFDYAVLAPVSFLIFAATGAFVGLAAPVGSAVMAGAAVGVVDATLGWAIAYAIGPGRPGPDERITALGFVNTVLFVTCVAAVMAAVAGWIVGLLRRRRRRRPA